MNSGNRDRQVEPIIGVVGGMGPLAGLDLQRKIIEETLAGRDQDHLTVYTFSQPAPIVDRTAYLLGETAENPAVAIADQLRRLAQAGATVAAMPCNSAHAPPIFDQVRASIAETAPRLTLLHMVEEVGRHLDRHHPGRRRAGILSTTGTYRARTYPLLLSSFGFDAIAPEESVQHELVHTAIYHPRYGIKSQGRATSRARHNLLEALAHLQERGATVIVLACTEIPLALPQPVAGNLPLVDSTRVLARALIREAAPARLRPWADGSANRE